MASTWGTSWNTSWATSWDRGVVTPPAPSIAQGGPGRRRRYPRRGYYRGVVRWLRNAEEEREFLESLLLEAKTFAAVATTAAEARQAERAQVRIAQRIEQIRDREAEWLRILQDEDDIILMALH